MQDLKVRRATPDDLPALVRLIDGFAKGHPAEQAWRKTYVLFWSMYGGEGIGLYVRPESRGLGVAVCIIAAICAEIQSVGGQFLQTSYDPGLAGLYERVAIGRAERACHVSALAFETLAGVAGLPAREIIRRLPDKASNFNHAPSA